MSDNEAEKPASLMPPPEGYADWLGDIKTQIHEAQQRASQALNLELVTLYWRIGSAILDQQNQQGWGAKVIDRLAHDLRTNFPEMKGFSPRNLKYMRTFAEAWPESEICAPAAAQMEGRAIGHQMVDHLCKSGCTNCLVATIVCFWINSKPLKTASGMPQKPPSTTGRTTFW